MKLKFALLLPVLMVAFISTHAFAEDENYNQAKRDWHNAIETFMQKVKVAEGFDYDASENSNLWTALDIEVKRLGNEEENANKGPFFFLCEAHKKVMRQFYSASYNPVKLGGICASSGLAAEKWVSLAKSNKAEIFRDLDSIKTQNNLALVKYKTVYVEQQRNESLIYQVVVTGYAVDCNERTASSTGHTYKSLSDDVVFSFETPRAEWKFDSEGYDALGMTIVCIKSGLPTKFSALESRSIAAAAGDAVAQYNLGMMYLKGDGVSENAKMAVDWLQKAAKQGFSAAQFNLGILHLGGLGVTQDAAKAVMWFKKAAAQGHVDAQLKLWMMYESGTGVSRDYVRAYAWLNLAAAQGDETARKYIDSLERDITAAQRDEGQRLASNWKKGDTFDSDSFAIENGVTQKLSSTGSGFVVSTSGHLLTNHHVANGCSNLKIRDSSKIKHDVTVVATDARNDLALLKTSTDTSLPAAIFRANDSVDVGENVVALGYPLAGMLASEVNVSFGYVSATAGLADDTSKLQISAPVQPGNSGGPLLDQAGNLIGVVVAKLDALKVAKAIGDIPQNINFAVKGEVAQVFLKAHKVKFKTATATKKLENTDIASRGRAFTVLVECYK